MRPHTTPPSDDPAAALVPRIVRTFAATLATTAAPTPPTLHLFTDSGYDGWIACRPHQTGRDTHAAIAAMGWTAAARNAIRLIAAWEDATLRAHLFGAGHYDQCLCILDVSLDQPRTMTFRPFTTSLAAASTTDTLTISWEHPLRANDIQLPPPVDEAIRLWTANRGRLDAAAVLSEAHNNDYATSYHTHSATAGS